MSEQTIFLLRDKPIIELNPADLIEHELSLELFADTNHECGECDALKQDIKERGIQDPLQVVKQNGGCLIVSGHRRTKIAKELDIKVPCIIRTDLKEEWQIKEFLIKDNLLRRQLNDYQKVKCGLELEPIEAKKAEKRKEEGQKLGGLTAGRERPKENSIEENFPQSIETEIRAPQTRDIVAKEVGFGSGRQYEKAKRVYEEASESIKKAWKEEKITTHGAFKQITRLQITMNAKPLQSLRFYNVWNFSSCDPKYGSEYPGRIPGQIIENLLYYHTKPKDLIIDPMAGSGTTIDVCKLMDRECIAYDIKPVRSDIKKHDIKQGFPNEIIGCDFIFLDPPYWRIKEKEYAKESISAATFQEWTIFMEKLAHDCFSIIKKEGVIALLLEGIFDRKVEQKFLDLPFLSISHFTNAGFTEYYRISAPLPPESTAHGMEFGKKNRLILDQNRDLILFKKE